LSNKPEDAEMTNIIITERLMLRPLTAGGHAKENHGSAKVLEKLGFVYDRDDITPHVDGTRFFDSREYYLELGRQ